MDTQHVDTQSDAEKGADADDSAFGGRSAARQLTVLWVQRWYGTPCSRSLSVRSCLSHLSF